jgi:hypothetical protein
MPSRCVRVFVVARVMMLRVVGCVNTPQALAEQKAKVSELETALTAAKADAAAAKVIAGCTHISVGLRVGLGGGGADVYLPAPGSLLSMPM